jgi:hypothetical protein
MTNVSPNSIKVYHEEIKGDKENSQDLIIIKALKANQPCTAVALERVLPQFKINVITRSLYNLRVIKNKIEIDFSDKCKITGRKAAHYRVIPETGQTKLF